MLFYQSNYQFWHDAYEGGETFLQAHLQRLSDSETPVDFQKRLRNTPSPCAAKSIVDKVLSAFVVRMRYCIRYGALLDRINNGRGIDNEGATLNSFAVTLAKNLAIYGRVGVFIDNAANLISLDDNPDNHPYCRTIHPQNLTKLEIAPAGSSSLYSLVEWQNDSANEIYRVWLDGNQVVGQIMKDKKPSEPFVFTGFKRIPFVLIEADSLMSKLAQHEVALTNQISALAENAPDLVQSFLTRQKVGATVFDTEFSKTPTAIGRENGLYYGAQENQPAFVAPPASPFTEARLLIGAAVERMYAVAGLGGDTESERDENLAAVVGHYGSAIENGERQIWRHIASYMREVGGQDLTKPPTVKYPSWEPHTESERLDVIKARYELAQRAPGRSGIEAATILAVEEHFAGESSADLQAIVAAVKGAPCLLNNAPDVIRAKEAKTLTTESAADSLGCKPGEAEKARREAHTTAIQLASAAALAAQTKPLDRTVGGIGSDRDAELAEKELSQQEPGTTRGENQ